MTSKPDFVRDPDALIAAVDGIKEAIRTLFVRDAESMFGLPGDETLELDIDDVVNAALNDYGGDLVGQTLTVEEHRAMPIRQHMPNTDWVIEHIQDYWLADNALLDENGFDAFMNAGSDGVVHALMDLALTVWAAGVQYRMAESVIRTHEFEFVYDVEGDVHSVERVKGAP